MPSVPPPIPQRISPPDRPALPRSAVSVAVQTDPVQWVDKATVEKLISELGTQISFLFISSYSGGKMDDLLGGETTIGENGPDRWGLRCRALREQNSELELERARLAQVRKQLELRLQESQSSITAKPTSL